LALLILLGSSDSAAGQRPNILIAISDDQSYPHASAYGNVSTSTPAFDRVARQGVLCTNAFVTYPSCSPSRASLLTGRYPWQIEHAGNFSSTFPPKYVVYPDILEDAGYWVGYTGKGWAPGDWRGTGRLRNPAGTEYNDFQMPSPQGISPNNYARNFKHFLAKRPDGKPFVFWFGVREPHRRYKDGIGKQRGKQLADADVPEFLPNTSVVQSDMLDYSVEIEWFDSHLGRMLETLEQMGELDNTLVVVTSDNGMPFPRAKANVYEFGIHVPMAVMWPARIPGGRVIDDMISFVDLAPTFLDAAGVEHPGPYPMAGESLLGILKSERQGRVDRSRRVVFAGRERHASARYKNYGYPQRVVRTHNHLYLRNYEPDFWPAGQPQAYDFDGTLRPMHGAYYDIDASPSKSLLVDGRSDPTIAPFFQMAVGKRPAEELYDIKKDPGCVSNLAADRSGGRGRTGLYPRPCDRADWRRRRELQQLDAKTLQPLCTGRLPAPQPTRPAAPGHGAGAPGPWDGDLYIAESPDGSRFGKARRFVEGGGVASVLRDATGRLIAAFQWFPPDRGEHFDRIAVKISTDDGKTWSEPQPINLEGLPETYIRPCDPTLVLLDDGRIRMYFTSDQRSGRRDTKPGAGTYSAISADGVHYQFEPGARFVVAGGTVLDCAVARLENRWHYYAPVQGQAGRAYHAVSEDGLNFTRQPDVTVPGDRQWLGCVIPVKEGLRFYGSGGPGGWSAVSSDGSNWQLTEDSPNAGADPGVVQTTAGRYLAIGTGPRRGSAGQRRDDKGAAAYIEAMRNLDSSAAARHKAKVHDKPTTVQFGRKIRLGDGLFPRTAYLGGKFYAFVSTPNGYTGRIYTTDGQVRARSRSRQTLAIAGEGQTLASSATRAADDDHWRFTGIERNLTHQGQREIDHDIAFDEEHIYHYAMLPGGAGQIRKYDSGLELVAQTPVFRAGLTDMILDQNIAVFGDRIYAGGEYREGGPWSRRPGQQNIPPDVNVSRGLHLRIYDKDLNLLDEKDLVGRVEGAAVPNQFWGLGVSQLRADGFHCVVAHTPIGDTRRFDHGESIGARQIFVVRFDDQLNFVDSKGPLSDTDCDNFWCTGSWYEDGRYYIAYVSVSNGCVPGPGLRPDELPHELPEGNLRLGIYDADFKEIETVNLTSPVVQTSPGEGGGLPGMLKVGDRLYVSYAMMAPMTTPNKGGAVVQELILKPSIEVCRSRFGFSFARSSRSRQTLVRSVASGQTLASSATDISNRPQ